jgi:hypothetical protein
MLRPVKRGFPAQDLNGLEYSNSTDAKCNINGSHAKRHRQNSISVITDRLNEQPDIFFSNSSGTSDRQLAFIEPNNGLIWHDNGGWNFELQAGIPPALSFIEPFHSRISDSLLSAMLEPNFSYAEASVNQKVFQSRIDHGSDHLNNFTIDKVEHAGYCLKTPRT